MADTKISAFTTKTTPIAEDLIPIVDSVGGTNEKITVGSLATPLGVSGTNTGDETAARIAAIDHAASAKTPPVDADEIPLNDSAATPAYSRAKLTWANLKAALNSIYLGIGATAAAVTGFSPASGKTLTVSKSITLTCADDTAVATLPAGTKTLVATDGNISGSSGSCTGNAATVTNGVYTTGAGTVFQPAPVLIYSLTSSTPTPAVGITGAEICYLLGTDGAGTNTGLANAATFGAPTGTPVNGQVLKIFIFDNGTPQTLAFNSSAGGFLAGNQLPLPTTTVLSELMVLNFNYNAVKGKWLFTGTLGGF